MDELTRRPQRGPQHMIMQRLLTDLLAHPSAWPFMKPVNKEEVQDYYDVSGLVILNYVRRLSDFRI